MSLQLLSFEINVIKFNAKYKKWKELEEKKKIG